MICNNPTMSAVGRYYVGRFSSESLFGFSAIISIFSIVVLLWMLGLSYLVFRADTSKPENRFMALLLVCEGLKASWIVADLFLYSSAWQGLWGTLWWAKINFFFAAHVISWLLYFSFPIYYRIESLSFLHRPELQRHAWYLAPTIGLLFWIYIAPQDGFRFENSAWMICTQAAVDQGALPSLQLWWGEITPAMMERAEALGPCGRTYDFHVVDEPTGLWTIALASPLISVFALLLLRSSMKQGKKLDNPDQKSVLTSRSLYIGFLGKVTGQMTYFATLLLVFPLLNGGEFVDFAQNSIWQFGSETTSRDRVMYFLWTFTLLFTPLAIAFEAMMFVHASLKDTVFGIDENLRKTFGTAVFTSSGVVLFILGCELMEGALNLPGVYGGLVIGVGVLVVRKPVLTFIDGFSTRLIPSGYSEQETAYLDAYIAAMEDRIVTTEERRLLEMLATSYSLDAERVQEIETAYDASLNLPSEEA